MVTLDQVKQMLESQVARLRPSRAEDDSGPPYPLIIRQAPYPKNYVSPTFRQYGSRDGNPREHIQRFLEELEPYTTNDSLCLREFPKSLSHQAYSWYYRLDKSNIYDWETMSKLFLSKFFHTDEKLTIFQLTREGQRANETPPEYVKRFKNKSIRVA